MGFAFRFIFEQIPVELHINSILPAKRPTFEMCLTLAGPFVALSCSFKIFHIDSRSVIEI